MDEPIRKRGRVYDPATGRWYKDGYAPFQLPEYIRAWCLSCGHETLVIGPGGAYCMTCSPVLPFVPDAGDPPSPTPDVP